MLLECLRTDLKALVAEIEAFTSVEYQSSAEDPIRKTLTAILLRFDVVRLVLRYIYPLSEILSDSEDLDTTTNADTLNIKGLNQNQILRAVAVRRLQEYPSLQEAIEALGIDTRTLKRYAAYNETDDRVLPDGENIPLPEALMEGAL